jgi:O-antigen/teichoic acid export membrane protein
MSLTARRIVQNSAARIGGYIVGAGFYFVVIILVARYLGAEQFGQFTYILAFVGIFQFLIDMGVRSILIRDIAADKNRFAEKLGVAKTLIWLLSFISISLILLVTYLLPFSDSLRMPIYLAGLSVIIGFQGIGYSAVLRAFEEMEWDILAFVFHKIVLLGLVGLIVRADAGLLEVFGAFLLANVFLYLYYRSVVTLRHGRVRANLDLRAAWALFLESYPLGIGEVLRRFGRQADKLLLAVLGTPAAVGFFNAAYKFLEAINPPDIALPLFPVFSRFARDSPAKLFRAYEQSLKFIYVISVPLAVVLFVLAERMIATFFGEPYREAGSVLRVLALAEIFLLPTSLYAYLFTSLGCQRLYTIGVAIALGTGVSVDLFLIPIYSHLGAAVGVLAAEMVFFLFGVVMFRRLGSPLTGVEHIWRPLLAGSAMGALCWWGKDGTLISLAAGVTGGFALYGALLLILQTFTRHELRLIVEAMRLRMGSLAR